MSGDLCPGGGIRWRDATCPTCGTRDPDPSPDITGIPRHFPRHTVDEATGEVWVQVASPKPEPDPWAVVLWTALNGSIWPPEAKPVGDLWKRWHRAVAEVRRLATTDPAIRAAHWREAAVLLAGCGYAGAAGEVGYQADRIANGGQP